MHIDLPGVEHIARLARLSLSQGEKETYGEQLGKILGHIEKLNELDTSNIPPTSHVLELSNVMREDSPGSCLKTDAVLANSPDRSKGFYRVPRIIE